MSNAYAIGAVTSAAGAITQVSSLTGVATMAQVGIPSTTHIEVIGWGVSFRGVTAADPPIECYLIDCDTGMSAATSFTPVLWSNPDAPASLCVGGTGATCVNDGAVTEGTIAASRTLDMELVHPQTGYACWFPPDWRPRVKVSRFLRLRVNASAAINCLPFIVWNE